MSGASVWAAGDAVAVAVSSVPRTTTAARIVEVTSGRACAEDFWSRHPRADAFQFLHGHAVEPVLSAGLLDGPDHHPPNERRNLLHPLGRGGVPLDGRRR